jgi:hypothetical protein
VKETIQQRSEFFSASRDSISLGQIRPQQLFEEETPISSSCPAARDWSSTLILLYLEDFTPAAARSKSQ